MPKRELVERDLVGREPTKLRDVVGRLGLTLDDASCPVEVERGRPRLVLAVMVDPDTQVVDRLDHGSGLFLQLASDPLEGMLGLVQEASGEIPVARKGVSGPAGKHDPTLTVDAERARCGLRARIVTEAAGGALGPPLIDFDLRRAAGAILPLVQLAHGRQQYAAE